MTVPDPVDPERPPGPGNPELTAAAQDARRHLHEEIERMRAAVEETLDEQGGGSGVRDFRLNREDLRSELERIRVESREHVKRKVRKSERRLRRSVREIDARTDELAERVDRVEAEQRQAEWRIHTRTEQVLDGILDDVRAIADRLAAAPAGAPPMSPRQQQPLPQEQASPQPPPQMPPQAPAPSRPLGFRRGR